MNLAYLQDPVAPVLDVDSDEETLRVLLIDDDPAYRHLCLRYLSNVESPSFEVVATSTAAEGLVELEANEFDCLLVDYALPDLSGTQVIRTFQNSSSIEAPPTIIMTADGGESAAAEAVRAGAADFLPKRVVSAQSLARAIQNAVDKARLHKSAAVQSRELQHANEQLQAKNEEIQRFYQIVSHEVKTPLAAAREFIALTLDGIAGPIVDYQKEILTHALDSCDQIAAQFNDLIEMTRLDAKKIILHKEKSSLDDVVTRCFASVSMAIDAKNIYVKKRITTEIPPFWFDCNRIIQVISNLLGNAIKYTEPGGTITLAISHDAAAESVEIAISDTGCGIAPSDLAQVFDRLYQVDGEGDDYMGAGLGLGLSIAQEIVALHDGEISATSVKGEGSTFTVRLPIRQSNLESEETMK